MVVQVWINGCMNKQMDDDGQTDGQEINGWRDRHIDGLTDGWTD